MENSSRPPGFTNCTAWASIRNCKSASFATSCGDLVHATSGWRRIVPVDEQGASSSTASNWVSGSQSNRLDTAVCAFKPRRSKFPDRRLRREAEISSAVTFAPFAVAQDVHHELAAADHDGHEHSDTDLCQWVQHHTAGSLDVGAPLFTAQELVDLLELPADSVLLSSELSTPGPSRAPPCS